MTKTIRRKDVIVALNTENLKSGSFFRGEKGCQVCAVGAVLRKVSFETWARKNKLRLHSVGEEATLGEYLSSNPKYLIKEGNYMGALSCYFEQASDGCRYSDTVVLRRTIAFVKKYFPVRFELTLKLSMIRDA